MAPRRWALLAALLVAACGGGAKLRARPHGLHTLRPPVAAPLTLRLASPALSGLGRIPARYTCAGVDISPPLRWSGVPRGTRELALVMVDPDAPGGPFTHWALAGLAPTQPGLQAGQVPAGAVLGRNDFGKLGYGGPCPPAGRAHAYVIELLALRDRARLSPGFRSGALKRLPPLAAGVLVGVFARR